MDTVEYVCMLKHTYQENHKHVLKILKEKI